MHAFWIGLVGLALLLHVRDIRRVVQTPSLSMNPRASVHGPLISVLIPARNEVSRIGACLAGLALQSYRDFEVIVIDDHSTDGTADLVHGYHGTIPQLTVALGMPLPLGWAGKNWACWQAAEMARGDWLLFLDADVRPQPHLLAALADAASEYDLVSLMPLMLLETLAERLIMPAFFELLAAIYPFRQVNKPNTALAFAIGQCLMFRRSTYQELDGHRVVRDSILEDMYLAKRAKQAGMRVYIAEAPELLMVRMYVGWQSLSEGLTKNAVAGARHGGYRVGVVAFQRLLQGWLPLQVLLFGWITGTTLSVGAWLACGVLLLLQIAITGWITQRRFRIPAAWGVLLPLGTLLYFLIAANGYIRLRLGIGVRWKGRVLNTRD